MKYASIDHITIDADQCEVNVALSAAEWKKRAKAWTPPKPRYRRGVLAKYARLVGPASTGAVTDG